PFERAAVDRDLVRQHPAVVAAASGERHALIETEKPLARRWLVFYHDVHVRHARTQIRWQRVECSLRVVLKAFQRTHRTAYRPSLVRRRMPSRACNALSSCPSFSAAHTNRARTRTTGTSTIRTRTTTSMMSIPEDFRTTADI